MADPAGLQTDNARKLICLLQVLGLDAPLLAASWLVCLVQTAGGKLSIPITTSLFFAVWSVYLADRLWDARRTRLTTLRHRFAANHFLPLTLLALGAAAAAIGIAAVGFSPADWWLAFRASLPAGLYFCARLILPHWETGRAVVIACCFTAGVIVPAVAAAPMGGPWPVVVLALAMLLTANASLCTWSEQQEPKPVSHVLLLIPAGLLFAAFLPTSWALIGWVGLSSCALLAMLAWKRQSFPKDSVSALSDLAVLGPAVAGLILR